MFSFFVDFRGCWVGFRSFFQIGFSWCWWYLFIVVFSRRMRAVEFPKPGMIPTVNTHHNNGKYDIS